MFYNANLWPWSHRTLIALLRAVNVVPQQIRNQSNLYTTQKNASHYNKFRYPTNLIMTSHGTALSNKQMKTLLPLQVLTKFINPLSSLSSKHEHHPLQTKIDPPIPLPTILQPSISHTPTNEQTIYQDYCLQFRPAMPPTIHSSQQSRSIHPIYPNHPPSNKPVLTLTIKF